MVNKILKYTTFILLLTWVNTGITQSQNWIKQLNSPSNDDAAKLDYADSLVIFYRKINPDSAIIFSRRVFYHAVAIKDTGSADYAHVLLGSLHRTIGNYDSSLYYYNFALASYKSRNYEEGIASIYNNLATLYKTQSRYDLAIKNYFEAVEIFEKGDNFNALGNLYSNFAGLYFRLENYQKAYDYWVLAEINFVKDDSAYEITHCYRGHARLFLEWNQLEKACTTLNKALKFDAKNKIDVYVLEDYLLYMELYNKQENFSKFKKVADSARFYLNTIDKPLNTATYFEQMGDYFVSMKNQNSAIEMFDSALVLLNAHEVPDLRLRVLKKNLKAALYLNFSDQAIEMIEEIEVLEDIVIKLRHDRITQETDAEYDLQDKVEKIDLLNEKNRTAEKLVISERELRENSQKQAFYLLLGIVIFCGLLVYGIFANKKLKSTQNQLKKSVEQKEFLFKELNHRVKNNLHIVNSFLGIEMHGKSEETQEILRVCENRIHSLGLLHDMLYQGELNEKVSLKLYFDKLIAFISTTLVAENIELSLSVISDKKIPSQHIVLLGLITNELITNALKYAKDKDRVLKINVQINFTAMHLTLSVADNGIGLFEDFNPTKTKNLGMKMAYGLTNQLGGNFSYQNANPGSRFIVSVPINK